MVFYSDLIGDIIVEGPLSFSAPEQVLGSIPNDVIKALQCSAFFIYVEAQRPLRSLR